VMQRGHVAHKNAHEIIARGFAKLTMRKADGGVCNYTQITSKIVGRLSP
jgi:hypothetical protein